MNVLAVTPWGGACGIANYAASLLEAVQQADPAIVFEPRPEALDPVWVFDELARAAVGVIWLNYHRGLHSRWTPEAVQHLQAHGVKVLITFHDTYGEREPDPLTRDLYTTAEAFVVHEPCVALPRAHVIRQGVPDWQSPYRYDRSPQSWCGRRPLLGTCGFNFPWKNFDRLAAVTAEAGWAYLVLSNNATDADAARWLATNPHSMIIQGVLSTAGMVGYLAGCDATAFPYECANSGTSGAIRLGLAARKPVLAFAHCRQFRDLFGDADAAGAIRWAMDWRGLGRSLRSLDLQRVDPGIVYLAERDAWTRQGQRYATLFRSLA